MLKVLPEYGWYGCVIFAHPKYLLSLCAVRCSCIYNVLSRICEDYGDFNQALEYAEKSISKITKKNGKISISAVAGYLKRPIILIKMGKYRDAYKQLSQLYEAADKIFGKINHPYKADIYCHYAYALFKSRGALARAKDILIKSQNMLTEVFGKDNIKSRTLGMSYMFLGEIYEEEKYYTKAQLGYSKALQLFLNGYNGEAKATDDFSYLYARLAIINVKLKDIVTAHQHLDLHRKVFGHEHHRTIQIINYFIDNKLSVGF